MLEKGNPVSLLQIFEEEETFWFSRSSERWMLEGDNNTSYFRRIVNGRKRKNTTYSLKKDDVTIQGTSYLLTHATEYYKVLFGHGEGNKVALLMRFGRKKRNFLIKITLF
jgi:hypothetical protein